MDERVEKPEKVPEKKYWILTYIPVFDYPEEPEDEDAYYATKEEAMSEVRQAELMQPHNLYYIIEKK